MDGRRRAFLRMMVAGVGAPGLAASEPAFRRVDTDRGYSLWTDRTGGQSQIRDANGRLFRFYRDDPEEVSSVTVHDGYRVRLPLMDKSAGKENPIVVLRNGRLVGEIEIYPLLLEWLSDDDFWGGSSFGARYSEFVGGMPWFFTDARRIGKSVWAILRFYNAGASSHGQSLSLEFTVSIDVEPEPKLHLLRRLKGAGGVAIRPSLRTFEVGGVRFLHDPPGVFALDAAGRAIRLVASVPEPAEVAGVIDRRWLLLADSYGVPLVVQSVDLLRAKTEAKPIRGPWHGGYDAQLTLAGDAPYFAVRWSPGSYSRKYLHRVVRLPDAQSRSLKVLSNSSMLSFWGSRLIEENWPRVLVTDAGTGRLLADLRHPVKPE